MEPFEKRLDALERKVQFLEQKINFFEGERHESTLIKEKEETPREFFMKFNPKNDTEKKEKSFFVLT